MKKWLQRFFEKVSWTESGCHEWTAGRFEKGYGVFRNDGRNLRAHRVAYEIAFGPIPDGMLVLHKCDNPACVNPDHLFVGSQKDNMQDMVKKGRQRIAVTDARRRPRSEYTNNSSGHVGVYRTQKGLWTAKIGNTYLGAYKTKEGAIAARKKAEAEYV